MSAQKPAWSVENDNSSWLGNVTEVPLEFLFRSPSIISEMKPMLSFSNREATPLHQIWPILQLLVPEGTWHWVVSSYEALNVLIWIIEKHINSRNCNMMESFRWNSDEKLYITWGRVCLQQPRNIRGHLLTFCLKLLQIFVCSIFSGHQSLWVISQVNQEGKTRTGETQT